MANNLTPAQNNYEAAVEQLSTFCYENTELEAVILDDVYPFRVQFIPEKQLSLFDGDRVDENGEIHDMTVTVGLTTTVKSSLNFKMDSKLLKKLIKLAENVGTLYYHAFREAADHQAATEKQALAE